MPDPLRDPEDPELLDETRARRLAELVETCRLASGAVRYGRIGRVGCARVVVNPYDPLPGGNHACALDGTPAEVGATLLRLEQTFADVGRAEAVVYASPTTVEEIDGIADDAGWQAAEELVAVVCRGEPAPADRWTGPAPRPAQDADLPAVTALLGDELGLPWGGGPKLIRHLGHRLDDPRCLLLVVDDPGLFRPAGVLSGFVDRGIGLVEQVVVRAGRRRHGLGAALVAEAVRRLREAGALVVAGYVAEGGSEERFAEHCGFRGAYPVVTYVRRVDELLD
ncbi:MAG TPA: GNAT family N-acetyltransferase [Pseudonocardiaceae bacterium]